MGLLDRLFQGESGGVPDNTNLGGGLLNNPLLQIGMGILANNTGHYGAFAPALGKGVQSGLENVRQAQQDALNKQLFDIKLKQLKQQQTQEAAKQEFLTSWGQPNSTTETTSPTTYQNMPQGADQPNFNMQSVAGQTTSTPSFDQGIALQSAVRSGALDFKDYLSMTAKDGKNSWQDVGNQMVQLDANGQPTGKTMPKGYTPDAQLPYNAMTMDSRAKYTTPTADAVYNRSNVSADTRANNATSMSNNSANNATSIRNNNATQAGENGRANTKDNNPWLQGAPQPTATTQKVISLKDIQDTALGSKKSTAQVTADFKSKGYRIGK